MKQSKYILSPDQISKMSDDEMKKYLRSAWKSMSRKVKSFQKSEFADFSELLKQYETLNKRWGGFSGAHKGLNTDQLRRKVRDMITLFNISETKTELQDEGLRNIKNFFREPRFTKAFINAINNNKKLLSEIANANDKFIHDIMPSDDIKDIFEEDISEEEQYKKLLTAVSEELDLRDNEEKEKLINENFNSSFEYVSKGKWRDVKSGGIYETNKKW